MKRMKVELTPLGNKIKFRVAGKVMCSRSQTGLRNSGTYDSTDCVWKSIFGSSVKIDAFLKANRKRCVVMDIEAIYDSCDYIV